MPLGHKRYPQSLEHILDFSEPMSLVPHQSKLARLILDQLMKHYGLSQVSRRRYKPAVLIQAVFDYASSEDAFLILYFSFLYETCCTRTANNPDNDSIHFTHYLRFLEDFPSCDVDALKNLDAATEDFAEYIVEDLLLLLRASSVKTPQPTPTSLSSLPSATASPRQRISALRQSCLIRDHHQCVIFRSFDRREAERRLQQDGENCRDDNGEPLRNR
ncbi:hypothetical protein BDW69DRAFT_89938 [Aspergillus filifer]